MKKILLILLTLISGLQYTRAQVPKVETSAAFDEPGGIESKVIQCRNGNTFLLTFTKRDGIYTTLFDKSRKIIHSQQLEGTGVWDRKEMMRSEVEGIYEINGQIVIFLDQLDGRTPRLYRIVLDPATGALTEEAKVAEMPKYGFVSSTERKTFFVEKDPASDCYAVVAFDAQAHETDNRIKVLHFNGKHELINEALYTSPGHKYKYTRYIGMTVDGERQVFICCYVFNTRSSGGKASMVYASRLKAGSKEMEHHPLDVTDDFKETQAIMQYNEYNKTIQLLTLSELETENKYMGSMQTTIYQMLLTVIDPQSMSVLYNKQITGRTLSQYKVSAFNDKKGFSGLPQDMVIRDDNSATIVFEEQSAYYSNGSLKASFIQDMGIIHFDDKGNETDGFVVQKDQKCKSVVPALSMHDRRRNYVGFERIAGFGYAKGGFYSYDYVVTPKHSYIIFNDHPDNFQREERKKRQNVVAISETNTICYEETNGKMKKFHLFGTPADNHETKFSFISAANYQAETHTYATLMIEKTRKKKEAKLAWVTLD